MKTKRRLQSGDLLLVERGRYYYCGIYEGDGNVIYAMPEDSKNAVIHRTTFENFKGGSYAKVIDINGGINPKKTLERARSLLGEKYCDFATNNSVHFAVWCQIGGKREIAVSLTDKKIVISGLSTGQPITFLSVHGPVIITPRLHQEYICKFHDVVEQLKTDTVKNADSEFDKNEGV